MVVEGAESHWVQQVRRRGPSQLLQLFINQRSHLGGFFFAMGKVHLDTSAPPFSDGGYEHDVAMTIALHLVTVYPSFLSSLYHHVGERFRRGFRTIRSLGRKADGSMADDLWAERCLDFGVMIWKLLSSPLGPVCINITSVKGKVGHTSSAAIPSAAPWVCLRVIHYIWSAVPPAQLVHKHGVKGFIEVSRCTSSTLSSGLRGITLPILWDLRFTRI